MITDHLLMRVGKTPKRESSEEYLLSLRSLTVKVL